MFLKVVLSTLLLLTFNMPEYIHDHVDVKSGKEHIFQNYSRYSLLLCIYGTTQQYFEYKNYLARLIA